MVYEAVLLFGVIFAAGLLFDVSTQNLNPDVMRHWRQLYLFVVLGAYFTYFWGHGGQTLPMQTWHIRVVNNHSRPITFRQASLRYCLSWMWFLPALVLSYAFDIQHWPSMILFLIGMILWALTSRFDKDGQFLHDKLAGTQIVTVAKLPRISDTE
jgi:uncharacterized RDD family membrane protein YckC